MKITIDLNDPDIQRQIQIAIDAKVSQVAAERVQAAIDGCMELKLQRLTDARLDEMAAVALSAGIKAKLEARQFYNEPSLFQKALAQEMAKLLREGLKHA